jgi:hypothetical protein
MAQSAAGHLPLARAQGTAPPETWLALQVSELGKSRLAMSRWYPPQARPERVRWLPVASQQARQMASPETARAVSPDSVSPCSVL